jgi:hypothetical protein
MCSPHPLQVTFLQTEQVTGLHITFLSLTSRQSNASSMGQEFARNVKWARQFPDEPTHFGLTVSNDVGLPQQIRKSLPNLQHS